MGAGFEAYDAAGNLQFTTEANAYTIVSSGSMSVTNMSNSYGQIIIPLSNNADMVIFRSSDCVSMSGYRLHNSYKILTFNTSGTIYYKVIRPFNAIAASVDNLGLQLFSATGELLYSALQSAVFISDYGSVYGENGIGDIGATITTGTNTYPYALVLGNEFIFYTGESGTDSIERAVSVTTTSNAIVIANDKQSDWPTMPGSGSGLHYPGTYTIAAVI